MGGPDPVAKGALLVDEVMEQVAVLADEARRGRRVVVRAEEGAERRVGLEPGQGPAQRLGMDGDVGVEEEDRAGAGGLGAQVAGGGRALRASGSRTTVAPARAATAAESSVEPSSTTISSKSVRCESRSRRRQCSKSRPPLRTGTTTESDGLRGPGLAGPAGTSSMIHPRPSKLDTCRNASPSVGSPEHAPTPHGDGTGRIDRRGILDDVSSSRAAATQSRRAGELYPEPPGLSIVPARP